jgi:Tfp pilus assembly protein PilN
MSSVQFNLLPDIKMQYVKAQKTQGLVITIFTLTAVASLVIFVLTLFTADIVQKKQLTDAQKNLKDYTSQLKAKPNVERIVTVQNQLQALVALHQNKHVTSRLFTYLPSLTPTNVQISELSLAYASADSSTAPNTVLITGTSDSQQSINTFIDTLKFTTYSVGSSIKDKNAFSNVLETSFSLDADNGGANYTISAEFDPMLFSNNLGGEIPKLTVPHLTSTRSSLGDPSNPLLNGSIKSSDSKKDGN